MYVYIYIFIYNCMYVFICSPYNKVCPHRLHNRKRSMRTAWGACRAQPRSCATKMAQPYKRLAATTALACVVLESLNVTPW